MASALGSWLGGLSLQGSSPTEAYWSSRNILEQDIDFILLRSTQPFIHLGVDKSSTNFGWGYGGNVASVGRQVILCDPVWHVSSHWDGCGTTNQMWPMNVKLLTGLNFIPIYQVISQWHSCIPWLSSWLTLSLAENWLVLQPLTYQYCYVLYSAHLCLKRPYFDPHFVALACHTEEHPAFL